MVTKILDFVSYHLRSKLKKSFFSDTSTQNRLNIFSVKDPKQESLKFFYQNYIFTLLKQKLGYGYNFWTKFSNFPHRPGDFLQKALYLSKTRLDLTIKNGIAFFRTCMFSNPGWKTHKIMY